MTRNALLNFLRAHDHAVEATVTAAGAPQAAVVGIVVTDAFELFFDTLDNTRKYANLRTHPKMAFVIDWEDSQTAQYEGVADLPSGAKLAELKKRYFATFPDGPEREAWPGISYVRVRPVWIRYSDFRSDPPKLIEFTDFAAGPR